METTIRNNRAALAHLGKGEWKQALRVAGPLLEDDPADLLAWYGTARALLGLGATEAALRNLRSAITAMAESCRPIPALAYALEIRDLGHDVRPVITRIAELYGAGSTQVTEQEIAPPPLPSLRPVPVWGDETTDAELITRAKGAMAVSWGQQALVNTTGHDLPFVPLLSWLSPADFVDYVSILKRIVYQPEDVIIEQGAPGDAMFVVAEGEVLVVRRQRLGGDTDLARLGPGAFFGEMALVSRSPRAAEVRAIDRTVVLCADKSALEQLASRLPQIGNVLVAFCHARMLENLMRISPVLAPVPAEKRPEVIARFGTDYREAGSVIIEEGHEGPGLFVIVSGRVDVRKIEGGGSSLVARLGPGDLFGEISLVMRRTATASVIAIEDSALLFLPRDDFNAAIGQHPELLKGVYDIALDRDTQNNSILASDAAAEEFLVLL